MNTVERIKTESEKMTKTERKVANWILENPSEAAFLTLERTAGEIGTSTTSVLRFSRSLGFYGFKDFQESIRKELTYRPNLADKYKRTVEKVGSDTLFSATFTESIRLIEETFIRINGNDVERAAALLSDAGRVFTFGMKESYALAHYAYTRLMTVRRDTAVLSAGMNGEIEAILSLKPGDVCLAYLFHRYTREALTLLPLIKKQGVSVILITDELTSETASLSDVCLECKVDAGSIKNTFISPAVLTDYFCNALAVKGGENVLNYMKEAETLFRMADVLGDR